MIKSLIIKLTKAGISFLKKRGVDLYLERELTEDEKRIGQLKLEIDAIKQELLLVRLDIIKRLDKFYIEIEDVYMANLATSKDEPLKVYMTQHWANMRQSMIELANEHTNLLSALVVRCQELEKISSEKNGYENT